MGYESEMYADLNQNIKPRLAVIEKLLGINQPADAQSAKDEVEDLTPETKLTFTGSGEGASIDLGKGNEAELPPAPPASDKEAELPPPPAPEPPAPEQPTV